MNTSDLLEKLLRSGLGSGTSASSGGGGLGGAGGLGGLLGGLLRGGSPNAGGLGGSGGGLGGSLGGSGGGLGGMGGGLGGLLGGLLGGNAGGAQGRSGGKYAALASLGMMAFQAYQAWQRQRPAAPQQAFSTIDTLEGPAAEAHSHAILRALIAASKADGTIDDQEQAMITAEINRHTEDPELQQWLQAEVAKPLSAAEVAESANEPGIAAEMYLASVMLVGDQQVAERNYLDELASALQLEPQLQAQLEQQARGAQA